MSGVSSAHFNGSISVFDKISKKMLFYTLTVNVLKYYKKVHVYSRRFPTNDGNEMLKLY